MAILVTGASGFVGRRLVEVLAARGLDVVAIARKPATGPIGSLANVRWIVRDIARDGVDVTQLSDVDTVVHLAGATLGAGVDEHLFLSANEMTTVRLMQVLAGQVRRVVFASSQVVYGDARHRSVTEEFPLHAEASAYACSKVNCENWLRWFQARHGGQYLALRLCGFVEGGGLVDYLIDRALADATIELFSRGDVCRDYLPLAKGVDALAAAALGAGEAGFLAVNVGSGQVVSAAELATIVVADTGSASRIEKASRNAPQGDFVFNIDRARNLLDFDPGSLIEAVRIHAANRRNMPMQG